MTIAIRHVTARMVLDSRGHPTVEVDVVGETGRLGRTIVPSGASTGRHEVMELRDGDMAHFGGKGVSKAVANVRDQIAAALVGMPLDDQRAIDHRLIEL